MAIDIDADVASILGDDADFPRVTGTYTPAGGGTTDALTGVLVERRGEELDPDRGLVVKVATFLVDKDQFVNVTVRSPGDTLAVAGEATWVVIDVYERLEYVRLSLQKDAMIGRAL